MPKSLAVLVLAVVALGALAAAQETSQESPKIRVCVMPLENRATRSVSSQVVIERLVVDLNRAKPGKKDRDRRLIQAIAVQSESGSEVRDRDCDFVVRTTLLELREPGDMNRPLPGSATVGPDSMSREPGGFQRMDIARRATLAFDVQRPTGTKLVSSSVSDQQNMTAEALVGLLMDRVAARTNSAVRE